MDDILSDFDSLSDTSSYDDQDDIEYSYGKQASVILSSLEESIGKMDDYLLFERGYIHGDIVGLVTDPSGQMGRVININIMVDLESLQGLKLKEVDSKKLQKMKYLTVGDHVVQGPWLGKVDKVVDRVIILFDDGTKSNFTTAGPAKLVPISPDILEDSQYPYYPGQRVRIELPSAEKSSRWFCGIQNQKQDEGVVCDVDVGLVYVDWLGCALVGCDRVAAPPCLQDSKSLNFLPCFPHANWQLGDWCKLQIPNRKDIVEQSFFGTFTFGSERNEQSRCVIQEGHCVSKFQEIFGIVKSKIKVDVHWQDGSLSLGLVPESLFPIDVVEAHDFLPGQYVLEKGTCDDPHIPCTRRWGVVQNMDAKERTVKVEWKGHPENQVSGLEKEQLEEIVSTYELVEHPDYTFCLGDAVFRLEAAHLINTADGKSSKGFMLSESMDFQYQNEYSNNSHLSCIGIVIGFKNGDVEVQWATGLTTKVAPYEIFRIDKYDDISDAPLPHDNHTNAEEIIDHKNHSIRNEGKDLLKLSGDSGDCPSRSFSFPRAAIGFITSITASLFGTLGSTSLSAKSNHVEEYSKRFKNSQEDEMQEPSNLYVGVPMHLEGDFETDINQKNEEILASGIPVASGSNHDRQFDVVSYCLDHHFVKGAGEVQTSYQVKTSWWLKRVHKEWSILEKNLPEMIYVRTYEERIDLLRVAIVGASGTPYHDGLFFFDIFLPPEYPRVPPMVHYLSGGLRLNPNLYETGKVCLSLLNTWTGTGSEVWNPNSTVLQVLLSIQALVLNEKPYFNEAGYDMQVGRAEGEKNSATYNENAFLMSCKSMLYILRKPPKHFEEFVKEHFNRHCNNILLACKAYMEGVPVGCASEHRTPEHNNQKGCSTGFKIMLAKLYPKLVESFLQNGIGCNQFSSQEN